jgi:hypothetical protein
MVRSSQLLQGLEVFCPLATFPQFQDIGHRLKRPNESSLKRKHMLFVVQTEL